MRLNPSNISIIKRLLSGKNSRPLKSILKKCEPADIAGLFNLLHQKESVNLMEAIISTDQAAEVLLEVPEQQLRILLERMEIDKITVLLTYYPEDACSYFLSVMEESQRDTVINLLSIERRQRLLQLLSYPEDTAGRVMGTSLFTLPITLNASQAIEHLREKPKDFSFYYAYCVDENGKLVGVVSLREMATAPAQTPLIDLAKKEVISVSPTTTNEEVAQLVEKYNFLAIPVVDPDHKVLGVIAIDDVVDIIQEQATADIYASAGLQEDDRVYSPILFSIKNRLPWMLLNLVLASYVSRVVSLFEATMQELIVLATLNNIVAGMGGNTAIQTLTVVTRGLSLGDFNYTSKTKAILKEAAVGSFNGVIVGLCAGVMVYFWKDNLMVAIVICLALMLNSFFASTLGTIVPLTMKHFKRDPAAGSGVIVTVLCDCLGFFAFLGIATFALRHFH